MLLSLVLLSLGFPTSVISLLPGQDPADPLISAYVFVDESASLDLAEVQQRDEEFRRNSSSFINPGTTAAVVWIRFDVRNRAERTGEWVISLNRALLDPGEIYLVTPTRTQTLLADSTTAFSSSYAAFGTLAARFELPALSPARLYVRYRGGNWSGIVPSISTAATLQRHISRELLIVSVLIGGVMTLVLYVFVSFLLIDRQIAVLYAVAQTALLTFYLHMCGFTTVYLWPQAPHSGRLLAPLSMGIFVIATLQFARYFFNTKVRLRRLDRWMILLLAGVLIALGTLIFAEIVGALPRRLSLFQLYLITALTWITVTGLAVYATLRWDRDFWPIAISWGWALALMVSLQLVFTGALDFLPLQQHLYGVFVYPEALFMALGIALRVRQIRTQRVMAEKRLSRSLAAELEATQRSVRLSEEREWALQDLAEKGRLILAAGHDTGQMISSLRHYALGLRRANRPERIAEVADALGQIATNLDEVLGTAIHGSASGGIGDRSVALEKVTPAQILNPLKLIYASMAVEKRIDLRLRMTSTPLVTDRVLVARILSNLVSNALKYTDSGKVLVACRVHSGVHRFQVYDCGHGMKPEAVANLLHADTGAVQFEDSAGGHGAGLTIVKALATRVGATLNAVSVPGRGSLFELRLTAPTSRGSSSDPLQLVILDQDTALPDQLVDVLHLNRFEVTCATSVDHVRAHCGDQSALILVDEYFGGVGSGIQCAEQLRCELSHATVAIMTYDRSIEARTRVARACHLIVYKPLSLELLLAAAEHHIDRSAAESADRRQSEAGGDACHVH